LGASNDEKEAEHESDYGTPYYETPDYETPDNVLELVKQLSAVYRPKGIYAFLLHVFLSVFICIGFGCGLSVLHFCIFDSLLHVFLSVLGAGFPFCIFAFLIARCTFYKFYLKLSQ
jgi:hypothetical protein